MQFAIRTSKASHPRRTPGTALPVRKAARVQAVTCLAQLAPSRQAGNTQGVSSHRSQSPISSGDWGSTPTPLIIVKTKPTPLNKKNTKKISLNENSARSTSDLVTWPARPCTRCRLGWPLLRGPMMEMFLSFFFLLFSFCIL